MTPGTGMRPIPGCTPTHPAPATRLTEGRPTTIHTHPGPLLYAIATCGDETHRGQAARRVRAAGLERRDTAPRVPMLCGGVIDHRADTPAAATDAAGRDELVAVAGGVDVVLVPVRRIPARRDQPTGRPA